MLDKCVFGAALHLPCLSVFTGRNTPGTSWQQETHNLRVLFLVPKKTVHLNIFKKIYVTLSKPKDF